jgi:hypothetical protein
MKEYQSLTMDLTSMYQRLMYLQMQMQNPYMLMTPNTVVPATTTTITNPVGR